MPIFNGSDSITPGVVGAATRAPHVPKDDANTGPLVSFARSGIAAHWKASAYRSCFAASNFSPCGPRHDVTWCKSLRILKLRGELAKGCYGGRVATLFGEVAHERYGEVAFADRIKNLGGVQHFARAVAHRF